MSNTLRKQYKMEKFKYKEKVVRENHYFKVPNSQGCKKLKG